MSMNVRFMVYNAYGIGGTVKTIFNFSNYLLKTGKYNVEIISVKRTKDTPTLYINPKVKITVIQDSRKGVYFSADDKHLLALPSEMIHPEEDLYTIFNRYTDKNLLEIFSDMHDGVLVTTMPSLNMLSANYVDDRVLKIGQEHKSYADHTPGIQEMIRNNYAKLDTLTILTQRNKSIYARKIHGEVSIYVLGNGTEYLPFRAQLINHIIIAAGRYAEEKGYDMLIEAFGKINNQFPDWVIKIYGEGKLAEDYIRLIQKFHLEKQVMLEPGSDKLNEKLSEAGIHVCSSYRESFGMVIIEGFAMGIPCVSFACDGPAEIITDGYDGFLVEKEDTDALANAMAKLMSDENLRQKMGKNAHETAKQYDINMIGNDLDKIINLEANKKQIRKPAFHSGNVKTQNNIHTQKQLNTISEVSYESYQNMMDMASQGKIGFKTLLKMIKGWFVFKIR
ncbi:MAG: glycosyltransferase [Lachnospiraceae bacterium]|nr:glycosyltransferase [Lachnospiraceae bacterium]